MKARQLYRLGSKVPYRSQSPPKGIRGYASAVSITGKSGIRQTSRFSLTTPGFTCRTWKASKSTNRRHTLLLGGLISSATIMAYSTASVSAEEIPRDVDQIVERYGKLIEDDNGKIYKIIKATSFVPDEFIDLYGQHFTSDHWWEVTKRRKIIDHEFIDLFVKKTREGKHEGMSWSHILKRVRVDDAFLERYVDYLDSEWHYISKQRDDDYFLATYGSKIHWAGVIEDRKGDLKFLVNHADEINEHSGAHILMNWAIVVDHFKNGCDKTYHPNRALDKLYRLLGDKVVFSHVVIQDSENPVLRYGYEVPKEYYIPFIPGMEELTKEAWEKISTNKRAMCEIRKVEEFLDQNIDRISDDENNKKNLVYVLQLLSNIKNGFDKYDKYIGPHSKLTVVKQDPKKYGGFFSGFRSATVMDDKGKYFTATKSRFGEWIIHDPRYCRHPYFRVDAKNPIPMDEATIRYETSVGGSLLRLFMGPAVDGVQNTRRRAETATCVQCGYNEIGVNCRFKEFEVDDPAFNTTAYMENTTPWKKN